MPVYSEAQRRGRFFDDFFWAPLWMPPRPPPPAYSCRGAPCAWNLNEVAGPAAGAAPRWEGHPQPTATVPGQRCRNSSAPLRGQHCTAWLFHLLCAWPTLHSLATTPGQRCTARLLCAWHGPKVGSRSLNQLIQGTTNRFPAFLPRGQWDGCGVRGQD